MSHCFLCSIFYNLLHSFIFVSFRLPSVTISYSFQYSFTGVFAVSSMSLLFRAAFRGASGFGCRLYAAQNSINVLRTCLGNVM